LQEHARLKKRQTQVRRHAVIQDTWARKHAASQPPSPGTQQEQNQSTRILQKEKITRPKQTVRKIQAATNLGLHWHFEVHDLLAPMGVSDVR
jgi:hypothetical protein